MNRETGMITDVRSLVLESEEFGPEQVDIIRELLANDLSAVRALREASQILKDKLKSASGAAKQDIKKRLGIVEYLLGRSATAQFYLIDVGDDPFALEYLGKAYMAREQYHEAAAAFEAAVKVLAKSAGSKADQREQTKLMTMKLYAAGAHRLAGDRDQAWKLLKSVENAAGELAEYHYQKGCLLADEGDRMEALKELEHALTLDPHHPEALFHAAYIHDLYGNDELAQELYERCVSRAPVHMGALINLGILYEDKGEYARAARCFRRVLNIYPTNGRARLFFRDAVAAESAETEETPETKRRLDRTQQLLNRPVHELELSARARHCLEDLGVETIGDLVALSEQDLMKAKNFGDTSLAEIKEQLQRLGLSLGMAPARKEVRREQEPQIDPQLLSKPVSELNVSGRVRRCLEKLNIETVGQLIEYTPQQLLAVKNFGTTSLRELQEELARYGLALKTGK